MSHRHRVVFQGMEMEIGVRRDGAALELHLPGGALRRVEAVVDRPGELVLRCGGQVFTGVADADRDHVVVAFRGRRWAFARPAAARSSATQASGAPRSGIAGEIEAPMTGTVIEVRCRPGDVIEQGATLLIVSAMKMEHRLVAPARAQILEVLALAGTLVDIGQVLVRLGPPPDPA